MLLFWVPDTCLGEKVFCSKRGDEDTEEEMGKER